MESSSPGVPGGDGGGGRAAHPHEGEEAAELKSKQSRVGQHWIYLYCCENL